jgi:XTP/dITP diphosphohydrolase
MRLRFLSRNDNKIEEAEAILKPLGFEIVSVSIPIEEAQTDDLETLVHRKTVEGFHQVGYPMFVEHTGLRLDSLNGFPGGLTQVFWDTIKADRFSALFGQGVDNTVTAVTRIGYCDGKTVVQFEGSVKGRISPEPRGDRTFQWDCVFIPDGHTETYAEMGMVRKNRISMRKLALDQFADFLKAAS